jgi:hypothetical protein
MRIPERRRSNRPGNGDTKPCPRCGAACDFNERYRLGDAGVTPAWICDSPQCRYREVVRKTSRSEASRSLIRESRDLQSRARREMLKCRELVERSRIHLSGATQATRSPRKKRA